MLRITPGPWRVAPQDGTLPLGILSSHRFGDSDPEVIATIGIDLMSPDDMRENVANSRLIAAAPGLLDAARHAVQAWDDGEDPETGISALREVLESLDGEGDR